MAAPITRSRSLHFSSRSQLPPPPDDYASSTSSSSSTTAATVGPHHHHNDSVAALLPSTVTNIGLFLTNMRLLDLDQRPDWPDITPHMFSQAVAPTTAAGAQGQRQRVRAVEWALVMLFGIWDHEEARSKLYPLFPPPDQVQSVALRGALLRLLEQAKKNGILGRDVLIRKTMLDECRGDRLEEVLAVFSSAVLKKVVAEHTQSENRHPALAEALALERKGYADERTELAVLALAHKVSLRKALDNKEEVRGRYADFSDLLDEKELALEKRTDKVKKESTHEDVDADRIWKGVRTNWTGDERWVDALQYGDPHGEDEWLAKPFGSIWRRVEEGRLDELEDGKTVGLTEQLEVRIKTQQTRLDKWRAYQQKLDSDVSSPQTTPKAKSTVELEFGAHEGLRAPRLKNTPVSTQLDANYASLLQNLQTDLFGVQGDAAAVVEKMAQAAVPVQNQNQNSQSVMDDDNEPTPRPSIQQRISMLRNSRDIHKSRDIASHNHRDVAGHSAETKKSLVLETPQTSHAEYTSTSPPDSPKRTMPQPFTTTQESPEITPRPARRNTVSARSIPPIDTQCKANPIDTQRKADDILASMAEISPSPTKLSRHLSLADRARLSMVRSANTQKSKFTPISPQDADISMGYDPLTPTPTTTSARRRAAPVEDENDIVARTRLSMAGFEAAQARARLDKELAVRKEKKAKHAIVGTGRATKESWMDLAEAEAREREEIEAESGDKEDGDDTEREGDIEGGGDEDKGDEAVADVSELAEELLGAAQDDYDAVFRSRPRLKTSPVASRMASGEW